MNDVPLRKMSEPDEIAQFTSFLISDAQTSSRGKPWISITGRWCP